MKSLVAQVWPDNRVTVYRKREHKPEGIARSCQWNERDAARRQAIACLGGVEVAKLIGIELGKAEGRPLPCQQTQKSKTPVQRALRSLTRRGRNVIRRAVACLERTVAREKLAFITLTLSTAIMDRLAALSGANRDKTWQKALSRFQDTLRRSLKGRGLPGDICWVTELHPERSVKEGRAVPHVHLVAQTALKRFQWLIRPSEVKDLWVAALGWAMGVRKDEIGPTRVGVEAIKKSLSRYMSKYLGKGFPKGRLSHETLEKGVCPVRWYAASNALHKLIRDNTAVLAGEAAATLLDWLKSGGCELVWRDGDIKVPDGTGHQVWVAYWCILSGPIDPRMLKGNVSLQG